MEFTQYTCPVCEKRFENGDDVVVCPECGAPHHRECYESAEHCFYADKHAPGFSFENAGKENEEEEPQDSNVQICPQCREENEKTAFYCNKCGYPLQAQDRTQQTDTRQNQTNANRQGMPFGFGSAGAPMYDPLVGLNSEDEIADNVKVGEAAKFIGKSTPYYLQVFNRIKLFGSSKFNFSAFLFSGAYFLYRKMYAVGVVLILLMIGLSVGSAYLMMSNDWFTNYNAFMQSVSRGEQMNMFSPEMLSLLLPALLSSMRFVIMLICGFVANRSYYKHCTKVINEIKQEEKEEDINKTLEARGGVNLPMAISFFASFAVIYEICNILVNSQSFWR